MNTTLTLTGAPSPARDTKNVFALLQALRGGLLEVRLPGGGEALFGEGEPCHLLHVHDEAAFSRILARGDIGFAEAYLDGQWDSPDLAGLLTLFAANRTALEKAVCGAWPTLLAARLRHWLNRNNRVGSRRNIMAHYDLGNDFYALWLDPGMTYSSALFAGDESRTLEAAQAAKYRRILDRLDARPGQTILEIGCGWGGFAEMAGQRGLEVHGITLSPAQLEWARRRAPAADLRLMDYRDLGGRYDHVVSIEMVEAVGERWWPTYFSTIARVLKPGGKAVIQAITIADVLFPHYRRSTDFIQQHVFPGGMLPSPEALRGAAAGAGLRLHGSLAFGPDYARTLRIWRAAFEANWPAIARLGFDERFRRLWRFYLAYCEAGFRAGTIDVGHFEFVPA